MAIYTTNIATHMFNSDLVSQLRGEVQFLREQIATLNAEKKELLDRLMSLNGQAFWAFKQGRQVGAENPAPKRLDILGHIESMNAESEQDKKDKELATQQVKDILGGF